ncbi:hypothetical protein C1645_826852, partial [Glomus cerebriforme]
SLDFWSNTGKWETVSSPSSSVQNGKRKRFSELFGPDWEEKTVLCAFSSILESETVFLAFGLVHSPSVRALGIRKRFLDFISGMEVSSQNFHLMHLLKESLVETIQLWGFGIRNIWLWKRKLKHSALKSETEM